MCLDFMDNNSVNIRNMLLLSLIKAYENPSKRPHQYSEIAGALLTQMAYSISQECKLLMAA